MIQSEAERVSVRPGDDHMAEYANTTLKTLIAALAGCMGFADRLVEYHPAKLDSAVEHLRRMRDEAELVLQAAEKGLDAAQVKGLIRFADMHQIAVRPKYSPKADEDYYMVSRDALDRLLADVIGDCQFCDKSPQGARRCQRRKDLLECGITTDRTTGSCPYRRE